MEKDAFALAFAPFDDAVFRDVGAEEETAVLDPDGAFGPVPAVGQVFEVGVRRDQLVEGRVLAVDRAEGGNVFLSSPRVGGASQTRAAASTARPARSRRGFFTASSLQVRVVGNHHPCNAAAYQTAGGRQGASPGLVSRARRSCRAAARTRRRESLHRADRDAVGTAGLTATALPPPSATNIRIFIACLRSCGPSRTSWRKGRIASAATRGRPSTPSAPPSSRATSPHSRPCRSDP